MPKSRTSSAELLLDLDGSGPLTGRLESALRAAVREGRLPAATVLPSTRALALELGVSRGVVGAAYAQLGAEGYLVVRQGAAVRVAEVERGEPPRPESGPEPPPRYNLRPDLADYASFPRREWLASLRTALTRAGDEAFGYGDARGAQPLRASLAAYLGRTRGVVTAPERTFVTVGFAHGVGAACRVLLARGARRIGVEDPGHLSVRRIVAASGLALVPIPVDEDGLVVNQLAAADPDAVLVTPAHHFPTTAVLAADRRAALLEWAEARGALVLEDDVDAEFRYDRAPVGSLQGLAPERVVYLGSTSRTLAPALRLGWAVAPSWLVEELAADVSGTIIAPPALDQLALADFVERGELDRHVRRMRLRYRRRRDVLVGALGRHLPELGVAGVAAGLHVVAALPRGRSEASALVAARGAGIALSGLREHRVAPGGRGALLLGFARSSEASLRAGVRALATAFAAR
jgi:GntR family transcriptional regulator / MocR family aminotransferase